MASPTTSKPVSLAHKALEQELKDVKARIKATESRKNELVEAARANISKETAKREILTRLHRLLLDAYRQYLRADQRACLAAIENLWEKYAITAKQIESARTLAAEKLGQSFWWSLAMYKCLNSDGWTTRSFKSVCKALVNGWDALRYFKS